MSIFNSKLLVYQRVNPIKSPLNHKPISTGVVHHDLHRLPKSPFSGSDGAEDLEEDPTATWRHLELSIVVPLNTAGWFIYVYFMENPIYQWMMGTGLPLIFL